MPTVTYIEHDGTRRPVEVPEGDSIMQGALSNGVPGIDADCGGAASCATCHVFVDKAWIDRLEPPSEDETDLLGMVEELRPESRLSCQIRVTAALDGLIVATPRSQT